MDEITPTIENETGAGWSGSVLRQAARRGMALGIYELEASIHQLVLDNAPTRSFESYREHRDRCTTLSQDVMTKLEQHFRSRIYDHIDGFPGQTDGVNPVALNQAGYWKIELTLAENQVDGPNIPLEAKLESQNHPSFGEMAGISAIVTVDPDLDTICVQPGARSHIETSDMTQPVPHAGPQRPGLRDTREGSSETVLVEDLDRRYEECTKAIVDDIWTLVGGAEDDLREALEYDHKEIADKLLDLGDAIKEDIKSNPNLESLLTANLSQWVLSLDTVPVDDADYEDEDQGMSATDTPSAFELLGDMAVKRKQFELTSSGIPLLDSLFPRKIDHIPVEELVDRWEASQRSRALFGWI